MEVWELAVGSWGLAGYWALYYTGAFMGAFQRGAKAWSIQQEGRASVIIRSIVEQPTGQSVARPTSCWSEPTGLELDPASEGRLRGKRKA